MKTEHYHRVGTEDKWHWWYVARRSILLSILDKFAPVSDKEVLEVGAGTGATLSFLASRGARASGIEPSEEARDYAERKNVNIAPGDITAIPVPNSSQDIVLALDVLEHVEDDNKALAECARVLKPGGTLVVFVPAFMFLWGKTDIDSHHVRRYTKSDLARKIKLAGFDLRFASYFNFFLFLPILIGRKLLPIILPNLKSENETFNPVINRLLLFVFGLEAKILPRVSLPWGVSLCLVCKKH